MAATGDRLESARTRAVAAIDDYAAEMRRVDGARLGEGLIETRALKDRVEAVFAEGLRRFDQSGEYAGDGAIDLVAWLRSKCKLSGGAAAERVGIARQLQHLPQTSKAFATGELGYQHVAVLARTADHVGAAVVRKSESSLLRLAVTMDPGQFTGVAKNFEHRVDAQAALAEANRAYQRRYLTISEPLDGIVRIDGVLDAEAGALVRNAVNASGPPAKDDERTPGQRRADRLVELCQPRAFGSADGAGPRPHLIIRASVETLIDAPDAPGGELDGGTIVPAETVRRIACDAAISRILGKGELDAEITRASRSTPPATRRALAARDRGCVAEHCNRPPQWTDSHHVKHWIDQGPTTMGNLVLLCRPHHRKIHEEGWGLQRLTTGRWALIRPTARSRSA
jgi:uncharacterized protein DUF222/HNH endonuclease